MPPPTPSWRTRRDGPNATTAIAPAQGAWPPPSRGFLAVRAAPDRSTLSSLPRELTDAGPRQNEDDCRVCGKSDGQLLCCEMCPASYHLKCLDPPLDKVPRGDWHCPDCTELLHMNDIEKFLKFEERRPDPGGEAAGGRTAEHGAFFGEEEEPAEGCPQYYVKWKEESYIHCEWVKVSTVERAFKLFPGLKVRAQRFHEGLRDAGEGEDSDGAEAVPADWTTVDRVLAFEEGDEGGLEDSWFLVKWKGLGYDEASWEWGSKMQEVDGFKAAKKEYLWRESAPLAEDHEWVRAHGGPIYLAPGEAKCRVCKAFEDDHLDRILKGAKKWKRSADKARYRCKATARALDKNVEYEKYEESPAFLGGRGRELKLFEYQLEGLNWLRFAWKNRRHVILGDEMGLGKTIMTIAYFKSLLEEGHAQHPHLLIVPLSTLGNWERELDLWAPDLYYVTFTGNAKSRATMKCYELGLSVGNKPQTTRPKFNILLTTYENVLAESSTMQKFTWACVVVDEGHRLKNKESRLFKALQPLEAFQRVLLTGTPLQNNLATLQPNSKYFDVLVVSLRAGFLLPLQSLLSTHGAEQGMIEDLDGAVLFLRGCEFKIMKHNAPSGQRPSKKDLEVVEKVRVSRNSRTKKLYVCLFVTNEEASVVRRAHDFWKAVERDTIPPAPPGAKRVDPESATAGSGMPLAPVDVSGSAITSDRKQKDEKDTVEPDGIVLATIKMVSAFMTQGVNEMQTAVNSASYVTSTSLQVQVDINRENLEMLEQYIPDFNKWYSSMAERRGNEHEYDKNRKCNDLTASLERLRDSVDTMEKEAEKKHVSILTTFAYLSRSTCGTVGILCKSGKDRTGMSATLELVRSLVEDADLIFGERAVMTLREKGARRMNVWANTGQSMFAFNSIQRSLLPACYRPPPNSFSGNVAT